MGYFSLERRRARDRTWTLRRKLGEGGVATTYLGTRSLSRGEQRAAIKEFHADKWADPEFREQFLAEMEAAGNLRNGKIVGIIDTQPKLGRLVLELVDGVDLHRLQSALPDRRLPWDLVALIARELCYALGYAHRRRRHGEEAGVVHRDVKASNVLISYEGEVKLTDFGLAKTYTARSQHSRVIRGTVGCLSPEQTRPAEVLDGRSDLFSLGVMLYELLTGQRPFDGPTDTDVIYATRDGKFRPLRDYNLGCPEEFLAIVEQLLEKKREDRFQTAEAVLDQLELLPAPQRVRELGRLARIALPPVTSAVELEHSAARAFTAATHPRSRAWLVAAVSGFLVASVGAARMSLQPAAATDVITESPAARTATAPLTVSSPPATSRKEVMPGRAEGLATPSASTEQPSPLGEQPARSGTAPTPALSPVTAPVVTQPSSRAPGKQYARSSAKRAPEAVRVVVGSIPLPYVDIWIDDKPMGRGPIDTMLSPGPHKFAAGRQRPEKTVVETVIAGTQLHTVRINRNE